MSNTASFIPRQKTRLLAAVSAVAALAAPASALAADAQAAKPVCLEYDQIYSTEVLNSRRILFYTKGKNKQVWLNTMAAPCNSLNSMNGFVWTSDFPRYCDNIETIRVLRTGQVCQLGVFTPYERPVSHS